QILEVITRAAKKRKEAIVEYEKADRKEMAQQESDELAIIEEYLPTMMSEEEVEIIIEEKISEFGELSQKDFGKIMGVLMKELKGKADGVVVKKILTEKLK
ncbi:MAG: GatB/YqeY domain-containing protein, partial [Bacteroidales bacterium]|nr:GatB/YqeY domain-containing protein [Bacteroidales bacterium]